MKRLLILVGFLVLSIPGWSAIAPSVSQTCGQTSTTTTTCSASMTFASGDRVILYAGAGTVGETFSVADNCSSAWIHETGASFTQASSAQIDAWVIDGASAATCSITVTRSGPNSRFQWVAESYTGASAIGVVNAAGNTSTSTHSIALTTEDANNFVVAGFEASGTKTFSASVGNLRGQITTTSGSSIALNDNTSVSVASVTNTVTTDTNGAMAKGAIELRATGVSGRSALASDSGATVLLSCSVDCNYTLPGTPPSNRWNAIVSAQGTHVYRIVVNSPATLNGGSSSITVPQYQAVRVASDGTNYFATFLPIAAGNGISVTPSATAISIASSSVTTSLTTTASTTDNVTVTGMTSGGHCSLTPTNSGAAGGIASVYVSTKTTNSITVTHTATSGWTFDITCHLF